MLFRSHKVCKVFKAYRVILAQQAPRVLTAIQDRQAPRVRHQLKLALLDRQAHKAILVLQEMLDLQDHKAILDQQEALDQLVQMET